MRRNLLLLFVTLLPLVASAYDAEIDGIYYNFSGDEAEVTYLDYYDGDYVGSVTIPASVTYNSKTYSVTSIDRHAFSNCFSLTSITIPNSVTSIGYAAFYNCSSLTSVTIPNSVTSIGSWAFEYCTSLTSLTISNSVTSIGEGAFNLCSGLTSITIPNSVTSIGSSAFSGCYFTYDSFINNSTLTSEDNWGANLCNEETSDGLLIKDGVVIKCRHWATSITIPNSVTSIGSWAFEYCTSLTSLTIPNSVTTIGDGAFEGCSGLTSIKVETGNTKYDSRNNCNAIIETATNTLIAGCQNTIIPNSVTYIGDDAFYGCSSLTSITIPNSVTTIGDGAFSYCSSLTSITIPNSVTSIGNAAFRGCSGLTSITIPNSVTTIGDGAFSGCTSLKSVIIPNSVTSIGYSAFSGCTSLTSITIPNSVTSIGDDAFYFCNSLNNVYCYATEPPVAAYNYWSDYFSYAFDLSHIEEHTTLHVPEGSLDTYRATAPWSNFKNIVPLTENDPTPEDDPDGIREIKNESLTPALSNGEGVWYSLDGKKHGKPQNGINIIHYSDGTTRKVLIK